MEREYCDYCGKTELKKDEFVCCDLGGMICPDCHGEIEEQSK